MRRVYAGMGALGALVVFSLIGCFLYTEWLLREQFDQPLVPLNTSIESDLLRGEHMAKIVGCLEGCHGRFGQGGEEFIPGIHRRTAPTLSSVLPLYSDDELVRLIRYGIKRDNFSTVGMNSFSFWALGDEDLRHIISFLRTLPTSPAKPRTHEIFLKGRVAMLLGYWGVSARLVDHRQPQWGNLPLRNAFERGRYLASICCSECHGLDFNGNALETAPSLAIVGAYDAASFARLLQTATTINQREITAMSWVKNVGFTTQETQDLYQFLRQHHRFDSTELRNNQSEPDK